MESKICKACLKEKILTDYYKNVQYFDNLFPKCKLCVDNKIPIPRNPIIQEGKKVCSKCKNNKLLECFYPSKKEPCGYRSECIECKLEYGRLFENKSEYKKKYREATKDYTYEYNQKYYEENKEELKKQSVAYNRKFSKQRYAREKENRVNDEVCNLTYKIRSSINSALKRSNTKKNYSTQSILKCTFEQFTRHIESQFLPWMNWENSGKNIGVYNTFWQLDHIIPVCNAKTEEEVYLLNHWSNFQPLCAKVNNEKLCTLFPCTNLELKLTIIEDKIIKL